MPEYRFQEPVEQRRREDLVSKLPGSLGMLGWILLLIAIGFVGTAKPEIKKVFGIQVDPNVREYWRYGPISYAFYCTIGANILGITGLLLNSRRQRRKKDSYRVSLILLTIISIIGTVIQLYRF